MKKWGVSKLVNKRQQNSMDDDDYYLFSRRRDYRNKTTTTFSRKIMSFQRLLPRLHSCAIKSANPQSNYVPRAICTLRFEKKCKNNEHMRHFHSTNSAALSSSSPQVEKIFDKILQLDTVEVHLLTELVNEKMGFKQLTQAQREAMVRGGSASSSTKESDQSAEKEEKTAFDVKLTEFDAKSKIKVIKEIRAITGLGLKEAKELVEGAPKVVKSGIKMEDAEEMKAKLESIGAKVEIS